MPTWYGMLDAYSSDAELLQFLSIGNARHKKYTRLGTFFMGKSFLFILVSLLVSLVASLLASLVLASLVAVLLASLVARLVAL